MRRYHWYDAFWGRSIGLGMGSKTRNERRAPRLLGRFYLSSLFSVDAGERRGMMYGTEESWILAHVSNALLGRVPMFHYLRYYGTVSYSSYPVAIIIIYSHAKI